MFSCGQVVVLSIDIGRRRISLSMKASGPLLPATSMELLPSPAKHGLLAATTSTSAQPSGQAAHPPHAYSDTSFVKPIVPSHGIPPHGIHPHGIPPHGIQPHGIPPHGIQPHLVRGVTEKRDREQTLVAGRGAPPATSIFPSSAAAARGGGEGARAAATSKRVKRDEPVEEEEEMAPLAERLAARKAMELRS